MPEILGGLYSLGNRAKRQLRDLLSNPAAYLEQSAEKLRDEAGRPTSARQVAERTFNPSEADIERASAWWNPSPLGAMAGVIKQKGGNWLAGSVEDALRGLKPEAARTPENIAHSLAMYPGNESVARQLTVGKWIEGPLTKYVKTRMASPEDEVRRLAEQGVLHTPLYNQVPTPAHFGVGHKRVNQGFPQEGMASGNLARQWEELSDRSVDASTAGSLRNPHNYLNEARRDKVIGGNPWLEGVPENTPVFDISSRSHVDNLGFPHLIDELSNALNPASGLPRHLQLTPEAMQNLSMEKAVRRVHGINEWRAAQQVELNRQIAEKASLVREYPENNPKGLRWVELKAGEKQLPEGWKQLPDSKYAEHPELGQRRIEELGNDPRRQLEDQLKYEGDVMGHCVGGYCDKVLSGKSRIFSLRDARGEPHVTVEVSPETRKAMDKWAVREALTPEEATKYFAAADLPGVHDYKSQLEAAGLYDTVADRLGYNKPLGQTIKQIKGKQDRAPNEEYLPFVQDFVRNSPLGGQWSDVGDLENTGLTRHDFSPELVERMRAAGEDVADYLTEAEIKTLLGKGYASGGRVSPVVIRPGTETATTGTRGRSWDILSE